MRTIIAALLLAALALTACGSPGGSTPSPYGGAATTAPQATGAARTPAPSGDPSVDNYGY